MFAEIEKNEDLATQYQRKHVNDDKDATNATNIIFDNGKKYEELVMTFRLSSPLSTP